eukprot:jgi/Psemu1/302907/fgenesh1_kg.85_\
MTTLLHPSQNIYITPIGYSSVPIARSLALSLTLHPDRGTEQPHRTKPGQRSPPPSRPADIGASTVFAPAVPSANGPVSGGVL